MTGVLVAGIVTDFTDWLNDIAGNWWFLLVIFAIAYLDSVVPIVPGETTVIIGGVAAGLGNQSLLLVIAAGALGAFLGDNTAYLIGRKLSATIERWAARKPRRVARLAWADTQIRLRGGLLLITARFIPGGRSVLTISSGITRQPHPWFAAWVGGGSGDLGHVRGAPRLLGRQGVRGRSHQSLPAGLRRRGHVDGDDRGRPPPAGQAGVEARRRGGGRLARALIVASSSRSVARTMLAVIPVRDGELPAGALETIAECGGRVVLVGDRLDAVDLFGAGDVQVVELGSYAPGSWATSLEELLTDEPIVVLPASPDGRDLAPRIAYVLRRPLVAGAVSIAPERITVPRRGGIELHVLAVRTTAGGDAAARAFAVSTPHR